MGFLIFDVTFDLETPVLNFFTRNTQFSNFTSLRDKIRYKSKKFIIQFVYLFDFLNWNSLLSSIFPATYNIQSFKTWPHKYLRLRINFWNFTLLLLWWCDSQHWFIGCLLFFLGDFYLNIKKKNSTLSGWPGNPFKDLSHKILTYFKKHLKSKILHPTLSNRS